MDPLQAKRFLQSLSTDEKQALLYHWPFWARDDQLEPRQEWDFWNIQAGRGFGKTRTGAEITIEKARREKTIITLVGRTVSDVRDTMISGESGILERSPPWFRPEYKSSKNILYWPNGSIARGFSAERPDKMRGPQAHFAWIDETAAWRYVDALDQVVMSTRLPGRGRPQILSTSTPKATKVFKEWLKLSESGTMVTTYGRTSDNAANLSPQYIERIMKRYGGTQLGRQELDGVFIEDSESALWRRRWIDDTRVFAEPETLDRVVIAVDPSVGTSEDNDECGIVAVGRTGTLSDGEGWLLGDYSLRASPRDWAREVVRAARRHRADVIVAEANNGGEMVRSTIQMVSREFRVELVWASRGKAVRAEPVSAAYEQGRMHHVGEFGDLEDELCHWEPGMASPNRLDALVWGATHLLIGEESSVYGF